MFPAKTAVFLLLDAIRVKLPAFGRSVVSLLAPFASQGNQISSHIPLPDWLIDNR
jgi:hypothetical protein